MRNNSSNVMRAILTTQYMKAGETYYLRMRTVRGEAKEFVMDYIELCPECVYDNPQQMEDKW